MAINAINSFFPSQVASDSEKMSLDYGLRVGRAIQNEWFSSNSGVTRFRSNQNTFHNLRLYARGEQPIQKYKDELSINGDLSYLNLDWKPVPILSKFVDIVVNGVSDRVFDLSAYSQDPYGVSKRTAYMESIIRDLQTAELNEFAQQQFGINLFENAPDKLPEDEEELDLHMQLSYKQGIEIAEEEAISIMFDDNRFDLTKKRCYYDLATIGIGAVKNNFTETEGVTVEYVDPAYFVWSYTEDPYFQDIYYCGEVKFVPINELKKQFPNLTEEELQKIQSQGSQNFGVYDSTVNNQYNNQRDSNIIQILYFNFKTYMNEVYKVKETASGSAKIIKKDDKFNPPVDVDFKFSKLQRAIECLYEGALILGTDKLLKWEMARNMMRPKSDYTKVKMNYAICAPRMYEGRIESLVSRITGFADMIQLTHLKLQQVLSRMVPDGVYLDADGLAEIDLGNGTNYNPQEALNMYFQTGSVIGRSLTQDGDPNGGKTPIQEISNSSAAANKMAGLISTYNYYLQMIRDTTGLNEARDASTPDAKSLVGIQKMAAANSNVATRHILQSGMFLTAEVAESLSLRISDILEYSPTKDAFIQQIGAHNVATLDEMKELHLYDFGIFIDLMPDEEEKQVLENNIQMAIQQKSLDIDDAIDIRAVKNLKMANQLIKYKKKKKLEREQAMSEQNIKAQGESQQQTAQAAAQSQMQANQAKVEAEMKSEEQKNGLKIQYMEKEAAMKMKLMDHEFEINKKLREMDNQASSAKETQKDDRKDNREKMKGEPKNFESANDSMQGGMGVSGLTSN